MFVDNFEQIKSMLEFKDKDTFYFVQILKRKKENPNMAQSSKTLKVYYVDNLDYFDKITPDIIQLCEDNNARAYIHLNKRSYYKIGIMTMKIIAEHIANGEFAAIKHAYESACGQYSSATNEERTWLVDVDTKDKDTIEQIQIAINNAEPVTECDKIKAVIPTKNGFHLISRPFNVITFRKDYNDVDIHKNNPTILYF